jgi:protein O-mannosyl-transferase
MAEGLTARGWARAETAVAACAVVVYLGALGNRFALDDNQIVAFNALVKHFSGVWQAFTAPYWPPDIGGGLYRPLPIASYALDWSLGGATWWFHAVNLAWHAAVSVAVAALARRWSGGHAGLAAGLVFAVHPLHVEAVANVVGRAELMAALFAVLAVYAALVHDRLWWSAAAFAAGLLSKENAIVVPALIAWGWIVGLARPSGGRRRMAVYAATWLAVVASYLAVRWSVLHNLSGESTAPVFLGASPFAVRLTAIAALADVARLLVVPLHLRVDYSPDERTLITTPLDPRVALGLLCLAAWATLLWLAWRRGRRVEAFGLGWIGIAFVPVANLFFPAGVLIAERTFYLPSAGLALAVGAWLAELQPRRLAWALGLLVVAGGVRSALRIPVWRDSRATVASVLEDSPRSFLGPASMVLLYLTGHQPNKALAAFRTATGIYGGTLPWLYITGAEAAFATGQAALADSILNRLELVCRPCDFFYRYEVPIARSRGYPAAADGFLARIRSAPDLPGSRR